MKNANSHARKNRLSNRRSRGFSLIEVMIAVLVVSIGFVATVQLITTMYVFNKLEEERAQAHQILAHELEKMRLDLISRIRPSEVVTIWDGGTPDDPSDDLNGTLEITMRDASGTLITTPPTTGERVQIESMITWNPGGRLNNRTLTESLITYMAPK